MGNRQLGCRVFSPKDRLNSQFAMFLDQAAKVVRQDLAKNLIHHRHVGFAPYCIPSVSAGGVGGCRAAESRALRPGILLSSFEPAQSRGAYYPCLGSNKGGSTVWGLAGAEGKG
jgi:hypothetical protein